VENGEGKSRGVNLSVEYHSDRARGVQLPQWSKEGVTKRVELRPISN